MKYIIATVVLLLLLLLLLIQAISFPSVQTKIVSYTTSWLKDNYNIDASVGYVNLGFDGRVVLREVYLPDENGDTLAYIGELRVGANLLNVYRNDVLKLNSVSVDSVKAYISFDTITNRFNFDYIVDTFSSDTTDNNDSSSFNLCIKDIEFRRAKVKYDVLGCPYAGQKQFDYNHIDVKKLSFDAHIESVSDSIIAGITNLSLSEKSGLIVNKIDIDTFKSVSDGLFLNVVDIETDNSYLSVADISLRYRGGLDSINVALQNGEYSLKILSSSVSLPDFGMFYEPLYSVKDKLWLFGEADGTLPEINVENIDISIGDGFQLSLSAYISDYTDYLSSKYKVKVPSLSVSSRGVRNILSLTGNNTVLPDIADSCMPLGLAITADGFLENLKCDLHLQTSLGEVKGDGAVSYFVADNDTVVYAEYVFSSDTLSLSPVLNNGDLLGLSFSPLNMKFRMSGKEGINVIAGGVIPYVRYNDISMSTLAVDSFMYNQDKVSAIVRFTEKFGTGDLSASVDMSDVKTRYTVSGRVDSLAPYMLGLTDSVWIKKNISLGIEADFEMSVLEDIEGHIKIDSLVLCDTGKCYKIGDIDAEMRPASFGRKIDITSDMADIFFRGRYNTSIMFADIANILHPCIPTFFDHYEISDTAVSFRNRFLSSIIIKDISPICGYFDIPLFLQNKSEINIGMNASSEKLTLQAYVPSVVYDGLKLDSVVMSLKPERNMYVFKVRGDFSMEGVRPIDCQLRAELENDVVLANFVYDNHIDEEPFSADLKTLLTFPVDSSGIMQFKSFIMPSDLVIRDLIVGLEPSVISYNPQTSVLTLDSFALSEDERVVLVVDGLVSASDTDSLNIDFDNMSISDALSKLRTGVPISGSIRGGITLWNLMGDPRYRTRNFNIDNLTYNNSLVGDVSIRSIWNPQKKGAATRIVVTKDSAEICTAGGIVEPFNDFLRLRIKMNELPVNMAESVVSDMVSDIEGTISANVDVAGKISKPEINGYLNLNNIKAKVKNTGCSYRVSDSILFNPTQFNIQNLDIVDDYGRTAIINCIVSHDNFMDFKYNASLSLNDFMLFNNPKSKQEMVYGKFSANGKLRITGDESGATIRGKVSNGSNAKLTITLPESETTAATYKNIVFVSKDTVEVKEEKKKEESPFGLDANVEVGMTDNMEVSVFLSKQSGDYCSVKGEGTIRAEYSTNSSEPKLYGTYTISEGLLKMKLVGMSSKTFNVDKGSMVSFSGPISSLKFNITASYTTKADLAQLDESFMGDPTLSNSRVPASAVLTVSGTMNKFNLGYDITLPKSGEDLNQRVKSLVNTDELKIKEFAYLIGFSSFYPVGSGSSSNIGSSMATSLASSSISNGINKILGDVLGSSWTVEADFSTDENSNEMKDMRVGISRSFFNDRLIFSTDFGYQNSALTGNSNEFTNNFDIEFKLTKSGLLRLKGYRHANEEFYRQSNYTEGLGFVFTKDADSFKGLFDFSQEKKDKKERKENKALKKTQKEAAEPKKEKKKK